MRKYIEKYPFACHIFCLMDSHHETVSMTTKRFDDGYIEYYDVCNALGQTDSLITEHKLYKDLSTSDRQCCENYREIFDVLNIEKQENQITEATVRGEVYGSGVFHSKISELILRSTKLTSHGGDRKSEVYKNQAG